jgi:hypothetical protein
MAYENLNLRKFNMTFDGSYFYMLDENNDVLLQKLSDGGTAFSYPLDVVIGNAVISLEYDGINFWSLQNITGGASIKRWQIENNIVELKDTFNFTPNFSSEAFTVEHYHDTLASGIMASSSVIYLNEYTNMVASGVVLTLGPNSLDQYEEVSVNTISGAQIILASGTQNSYSINDSVNFYNHLWIFNSYGDGTLHKIDAYTGSNIITYSGSEYDNITACTFSTVKGTLPSTVDALVYEKNTNLKYLNVNTMSLYGTMALDNFQPPSTNIKIYDLAIADTNIYRLQKAARYYESNYSWTNYNYVLSTSRRFLDTVSISAYPVILPANGVNTTKITMLVDDQYGDGVWNKPVFFTDDDDVGFITINPAYTDYFFGTGEAITYYKAGVEVATVNIEGTATQYD